MVQTVSDVQPAAESTINSRAVYKSSVFATAVAFFFGVGIPCWFAFGLGWGAGLGAMCAFWGGPGFGVMIGGARVSLLEERQHSHDA